MITTLDNFICKRGERVWEIGISKEGYRPTMSVVHGMKNRVVNPDKCWKDYNECIKECDKKNSCHPAPNS